MKCIHNIINIGLIDIFESFKRINILLYFAWSDTKSRYKRSILGPFWIVISTSISIVGLGFIWSILLRDEPSKLVPSLTIGLVIWQFISGCILEASSLLVRNAHFIKNMTIPYSIFPIQLLMRHLINLGHNFVVVLVVLVLYPPDISIVQLFFLPGMILILGNLFWIVLLIALLGSRYRDFEQIIGAVMPVMFFLSPVIYRSSQLFDNEKFIWINPFSYLICLIRDPIMGIHPPIFVYIVSLSALIIGSIFSIYQFGKCRKKIAFWI